MHDSNTYTPRNFLEPHPASVSQPMNYQDRDFTTSPTSQVDATPQPEKKGILSDVIPHFAIGANKYVSLPIAGMMQIAGDITGSNGLSQAGENMAGNAEAYIAEKERESPTQRFQDIASPGDAARWAVQQGTEMAPQIVAGMVAGGAGAAAGRALAPALTRTGIASAETLAGLGGKEAAGIAGEYGAELGAQHALALRGAQAAQIANPLAMESSTVYQGMKDGEKDPYRALTYGALAALPDVVVPSYILEKTGAYKALPGMRGLLEETPLLGSGQKLTLGQRAKDVAKTIATATSGGAGQEALQTTLERIGSREQLQSDEARKNGFWKTVYDKGLKAAVHPDTWDDIIESSAAGGLMGGMEAIGGHGLGHLAEARQQKIRERETGTGDQENISPVPGPQPPAPNNVQTPGSSSGETAATPAGQEAPPVQPGVLDQAPGARDRGAVLNEDIPGFAAGTQTVETPGNTLPPFQVPGPRSPVADGPLAHSLAAGGIATLPVLDQTPVARPVANQALQRGIAGNLPGPVVDAEYSEVYPALPAPPSEMVKARTWANDQIAAGKTYLMQNRGVSDEQHAVRILEEYRKAGTRDRGLGTGDQGIRDRGLGTGEGNKIGIADILPGMQGAGAGQVDRTGVGVPPLQGEVGGKGSDHRQSGGIEAGTGNRGPGTGKNVNPAVPKAPKNRQLDTSTDSLIVAIAKLGGISRADIDSQMGEGAHLARTLNTLAGKEAKTFLHVISTKGQPLDRMRESLVEHGYLPEDADINTLLNRLNDSQRGTVYRSSQADHSAVAEDAYNAEVQRLSEEYAELPPEEVVAAVEAVVSEAEHIAEESTSQEVLNEALSFFDQFIEENSSEVATAETQAVPDGDVQDLRAKVEEPGAKRGPGTGDQGPVEPGTRGNEQGTSKVSLVPGPQSPIPDKSPVPSHVVNAVDTPRDVPQSVSLATKQQTKDTLNEKLKAGEIETSSPIRLTTVEELHDILESGKLREGKDFEGRSGISAQKLDGKKPIVAYGPNDKISAAIIFPAGSEVGKGQQPNEVKVNAGTAVKDLRFVIDGYKEVLSLDDLRSAVAEKSPPVNRSPVPGPESPMATYTMIRRRPGGKGWERAKIEAPAHEALHALDDRLEMLQNLLACVGGKR